MTPIKKRILSFWISLACLTALLLAGCQLQKRHVAHQVDQIQERAAIIADQTQGLSPQLVAMALHAYNKAQAAGYGEKHILTIIDYTQPSSNHRFWVINLDTNRILFKELVAHGVNSGELIANNFSDQIDSKSSSLGMYMTAPEPYYGRHGYALRLMGLEKGYNDRAWTRAIVIHSAPYVCDSFVKAHGFLGRSWGCPALNPKDLKSIINTIKGETLVFAYGNSKDWLAHSQFLH